MSSNIIKKMPAFLKKRIIVPLPFSPVDMRLNKCLINQLNDLK